MNGTFILHVEDDANDVFLLRHAFISAGITNPIHVASDGQEALNYLAGVGMFADRSKYPIPGLILLDLKLPRMSGLDLLQQIRARPEWASIVIIVLSASEDAKDIERAYRYGANSFAVKPMDIEDRLELAKSLKGWWLKCNKYTKVG